MRPAWPQVLASLPPRQQWLAVALLATLLLCAGLALVPEPNDASVEPAAPRATAGLEPRATMQPQPGPAVWPEPEPAAWQGRAAVAMAPAAPASAVRAMPGVTAAATSPPPMPASAPGAPALQYTLLGRYDDGSGQPLAWLATPQRLLVVRQGDLVDNQWRVERVLAGRVELLWLPGGERRSLQFPPS